MQQSSIARVIGVGEAASLLGASPASVRRWADQGLLPAYRTPGGQRRFLESDVERLFERMVHRQRRLAERAAG